MAWVGWYWWVSIVLVVSALIGSAIPEPQEDRPGSKHAAKLYSVVFFVFLIVAIYYAMVSNI
jgi:hypothetical protein